MNLDDIVAPAVLKKVLRLVMAREPVEREFGAAQPAGLDEIGFGQSRPANLACRPRLSSNASSTAVSALIGWASSSATRTCAACRSLSSRWRPTGRSVRSCVSEETRSIPPSG
jgi:hypothetical protein